MLYEFIQFHYFEKIFHCFKYSFKKTSFPSAMQFMKQLGILCQIFSFKANNLFSLLNYLFYHFKLFLLQITIMKIYIVRNELEWI